MHNAGQLVSSVRKWKVSLKREVKRARKGDERAAVLDRHQTWLHRSRQNKFFFQIWWVRRSGEDEKMTVTTATFTDSVLMLIKDGTLFWSFESSHITQSLSYLIWIVGVKFHTYSHYILMDITDVTNWLTPVQLWLNSSLHSISKCTRILNSALTLWQTIKHI